MNTTRFLKLVVVFLIALSQVWAIPREEAELVSYAQDLYRQQGVNLPRSVFKLEQDKDGARIFSIRLLSNQSTLSEDLLRAFQVAGAVSQHAIKAIDAVLVVAELEFSVQKPMRLWATGDCCEKLYNNRLSPDIFTEGCLRIEE